METQCIRYTGYFLPKVAIKDYDIIIDGQNVFDQLVKNDMRTYNNIQKIVTDKEMITQLVVY